MVTREPGTDKLWTRDFTLLSVGALVFYISFYVLLTTLPQYIKSIGGGMVDLGFAMGAFAFASLFCRPLIGNALDRRGRKWMVVAGAGIFVAAASLYWFARSVPVLIAVRALHGCGIALFVTAGTTLVADITPASRRGEAMGIFGATANVALAIGPPLGALILAAHGFLSLFTASAVLAGIALLLTLPVSDHRPSSHAEPTRARGIHAFLSPEVVLPAVGIFAAMFTYGPIVTFLPVFVGPLQSSLFFTVYAAAVTVARAVAGRLSDIHGRHIVIWPGMLLLGAALALLATGHAAPVLVAAAVLYGIGMAAAQPALYALAIDMATHSRRGVAMGTFTAAFELGIGGGSIAGGLIVQSFGYGPMFVGAGAVSALVSLVFARRRATS